MSVSIRLFRIGKKHAPAYRIVAANTRDKRNGRPLEILGHYNPSENPVKFEYNKEAFDKWVKTGAIISNAVKALVEGKYEYKPYNPKASEQKPKPQEGKTEIEGEVETEPKEK